MGRPRPLRPLRQRAETALLRGLGAIARGLPFERAGDLGAWLGRLAYRLFGRRRRIAIENLTRALGPRPGGEPASLVAHRAFEQLGRSFLEFLALPAQSRADLVARIEFIGFEPAREWVAQRRGAVLLTGHFGNWELFGAAVGMAYGPVTYLLPAQTNPGSDRYLNDVRRRLGVDPVRIDEGLLRARRALGQGGFLGMLPDQDARRAGLHVPFFGRLASTHTGPARLALRAGAPILVATMERIGRGRFRARVRRILEPRPVGDEPAQAAEIERLTREVTEALEEAIRERPDHWYWIHRRWKTPPPANGEGEAPSPPQAGGGQGEVKPISLV